MARPTGTRRPEPVQLALSDLEEISEHSEVQSSKVIVDLSDPVRDPAPVPVETARETSQSTAHPGTPIRVKRVSPARPHIRIAIDDAAVPTGGTWIIVLVYLAAATALGISIYFRFIA